MGKVAVSISLRAIPVWAMGADIARRSMRVDLLEAMPIQLAPLPLVREHRWSPREGRSDRGRTATRRSCDSLPCRRGQSLHVIRLAAGAEHDLQHSELRTRPVSA